MSFAYCRTDDRKRVSGNVDFELRCLDEVYASAVLSPELLTFVQDLREICRNAHIGPFMFYSKSSFAISVFQCGQAVTEAEGRENRFTA